MTSRDRQGSCHRTDRALPRLPNCGSISRPLVLSWLHCLYFYANYTTAAISCRLLRIPGSQSQWLLHGAQGRLTASSVPRQRGEQGITLTDEGKDGSMGVFNATKFRVDPSDGHYHTTTISTVLTTWCTSVAWLQMLAGTSCAGTTLLAALWVSNSHTAESTRVPSSMSSSPAACRTCRSQQWGGHVQLPRSGV